MTGAAAADFEHADGLSFHSETWIMGTKKMVELDWRRSLDDPDFAPCARKTFGSEPGSKVVSFKRIALPKLAPLSRRYRMVVDQAVEGETVRVMIDFVFIGRGRTEISLLAAAPWAARNAVGNAEIRLARILLSRARA